MRFDAQTSALASDDQPSSYVSLIQLDSAERMLAVTCLSFLKPLSDVVDGIGDGSVGHPVVYHAQLYLCVMFSCTSANETRQALVERSSLPGQA